MARLFFRCKGKLCPIFFKRFIGNEVLLVEDLEGNIFSVPFADVMILVEGVDNIPH